jgi:Polyketide cyclase / dehydrase and lipid transport
VPHIEMTIETDVAPEMVRSALLDFTPNRPELWPGLKPGEYKVYAVGDTWAEIREGNGGAIWARERYDWSDPQTVVWTVLESGFSKPGSFVSARVTPSGTGSRVHVVWDRRPSSLVGRVVMALIWVTRGYPVKRSLMAGLARIAAQPRTSTPA